MRVLVALVEEKEWTRSEEKQPQHIGTASLLAFISSGKALGGAGFDEFCV